MTDVTQQLADALREAEPVDDYIRSLVRLANTLSHDEWRWGQFTRPDGSPIETVDHVCEAQENSARQSDTAQLWGVDLGVDRPVVCYTGNGPCSERHAQYIAAVRPQVVVWILNELGERIERLTRERDAALTAFEASRAALSALPAPDDGLEALRELLDEHDKACGATKYEPSTQRPAAMHMYELQRQTFAAMYAYVRNKLAQEPRS